MKGTYLLTTIGRKSGKELTHPVQLIIDGERRWLVAPYGAVAWVHNARAAGEVRLHSGSDDHRYRVHEVPAEEAGPVLKRYVKIAPVVLGYFEAKRNAPVEDFVAEAHLHPVFELEAIP